MRAGKVISGEDSVLRAIRSGKARLVILSGDASPNTTKKFRDKSASYQIDCVQFGKREQLGQATGKKQRVVLAITDLGFSEKIKSMLLD